MAASILTNSSAMVALQTLRTTNKTLEMVNNQISTGKKVATAKDSAAVFAISKVMESDVAGFRSIQESLSLGGATASVSANAASQLNTLLNDIKGKIVSANEDNFDRVKLQDELSSLRDQIGGIVAAAQFNGLNLLSNTETTGTAASTTALTAAQISASQGTGTVGVLASLNRASDGSVTSETIDVAKQDLGTGAGTFGAGNAADTVATGGAMTLGGSFANGGTGTITVVGMAAATGNRNGIAVIAGDSYRIDASVFGGSGNLDYVARDGDTVSDIARELTARLQFDLAEQEVTDVSVSVSGAAISITNNTGAAITVTAGTHTANGSQGAVGGGLELLGSLDVTTDAGAAASLTAIEGLIQTTVDAQAAFGVSQKRIDLQNEFMSNLIDSFKEGIGALVDADLEEASARLQALQVQQQLGIQALSIANQAPQNILALFR